MGLNQEKNWRSKISWHTPFKCNFILHFTYVLVIRRLRHAGSVVTLKRQCHDIFWHFLSLIQPIWVPDKQSKMVSLKNSFSRRYSRKTWLRAVWYCAESNNLFDFRKLKFPGLLGSMWWYFENRKMANTARSRTPCSVILRGVNS